MSLTVNNFNVAEDGFLQLGDNIENITFHQNLNVFIVTTKTNRIKIFDPHSSAQLADVPQNDFIDKSNESNGKIQCAYLSKKGSVIFCGGKIVSLRQDHQGVLLLNSLFQTKVSSSNEIVTVELLVSEALQLRQSFNQIKLEALCPESREVLDALDKAIAATASQNYSNTKVAKWRTLCLELSLRTFSHACADLSDHYRSFGRMDPCVSLASALTDRLTHLMKHHYLETSDTVDRENMYSESTRLATFYKWPHMNYKWALPEQMAQAGFFHQPGSESDDRAMCFICNVCLVFWEPTDEPWSEHERHSPNCPFVRGEFTPNVPLSVTCAAFPALKHTDNDEIASLSSGNSSKLIATYTQTGLIVIWNISRQLKKEVSFLVDPGDQIIFSKHYGKFQSANTGVFSDIPLCPEIKDQWINMPDCDDLPPLEMDMEQHDSDVLMLLGTIKDSLEDPSSSTAAKNENNPSLKIKQGEMPLRLARDLRVTATSVISEPDGQMKNYASSKTSLIVGFALTKRPFGTSGVWQVSGKIKDTALELINMDNHFSTEIQELNIVNSLSLSEQAKFKDHLDIASMLVKENEKDTQTYPPTSGVAPKYEQVIRDSQSVNFVPYLLVYDLNQLAKEPFLERSASTVVSHGKGSSKKTIGLFDQPETSSSHPVIKFSATPSVIHEDKLPITVGDTKKSAPVCIQCIRLPQKYFQFTTASYIVNNILPTPCGNYVLVTVMNIQSLRTKAPGFVFLYKIDQSENNVRLFETPVGTKECEEWKSVPERVIFIQTVMEDNSIHSVVAACVTEDGSFMVLSLLTMETIFHHSPYDCVYNDVVYCNSTERICVTEEGGKTTMFHIVNRDSYEEQEALSFQVVTALCDDNPKTEVNVNGKDVEVQANELLVNQEITEENLDQCLHLTHFSPEAPRFVSTMAPCWVEMMQAQKQRRNPQHLHQKVGDADPTRTWRLRGDATTKQEHFLDLLFPPCGGTGTGGGLQIGHIDVKINFKNDGLTSIPQIQVTLLKQNLSKPSKQVHHSEESASETPFLEKNEDDILCGPVIINKYLDLSSYVATVALTSPALMACRSRSYLIHLQAVNHVQNSEKVDPIELNLVGVYLPSYQTDNVRSNFSSDSSVGCNIINDLSIKVYTCKKTTLSHDRLQRLALLERESFHDILLKSAIDMSSSMHGCNFSLDIFLWVLTVHLTSNDEKVKNIVKILEQYLSSLVKNCIILGDRSLAHKALKIILVAFDNLDDPKAIISFGGQVLAALLEHSHAIMECRSAGALGHYFSLLNHVKWCDLEGTSVKITKLLSSVASSVSQLNNPLHYLLQTKFNLHGLPFERQMFDSVPHVLPRQVLKKPIPSYHSNPYTIESAGQKPGLKLVSQWKHNNVIPHNINMSHTAPASTWSKYIYQHDVMDTEMASGKVRVNRKDLPDVESSSQQSAGLCGLLEVEPLHFSLYMASEGTKMEKVMPGSSYIGNPLYMYPFQGDSYGPNSYNDESFLAMNPGVKKYTTEFNDHHTNFNDHHSETDESLSGTPENQFATAEAQTASILLDGLLDDSESINVIMPPDSPGLDVDMLSLTAEQKSATGELKSDQPTKAQRSSPPYMLSLPPQHVLVIDRMHSGARRFVVLDFGYPVVLTDMIIPSCRDLVSLTLDIWLTSEEQDGERLAVACDIGVKAIVLSDLQPPPLCRYLKITTLGRYGMISSNIRIPVGLFYGHSFIFPWNLQSDNTNVNFITKQEAQNQITVLRNMAEDLGFRYSLSCSKLKTLLNPLLMKMSLTNEFSCSTNSASNSLDPKGFVDAETDKSVRLSYQECIVEQQHLNLVIAVLERLEHFIECDLPYGKRVTHKREDTSLDQLSTVLQYLINCLLEMSLLASDQQIPKNLIEWCSPSVARNLISEVCLQGPRQTQFSTTAALISRLCVSQSWWGDFLGEVAVSLFKTGSDHQFSAIRIYTLLCLLGQRSCESGKGSEIINAIVDSTLNLLSGIDNSLDMPLIWWVLLFLSGCLDITLGANSTQRSSSQNRWSWIGAEKLLQERTLHPSKTAPLAGAREKLCKRLSYHRQKLVSLETATKSFGEVLAGLGSWGSNPKVVRESQAAFSRLQRQHALKHFKDLCSIRRHESNNLPRGAKLAAKLEDNSRETSPAAGCCRSIPFTPISRARALEACRRLVRLLLSANPVEIDSFMLTCKVIGELARSTKPNLRLGDILSERTLESLLCQTLFVDSVSGGQWATHSLCCLLQDLLEGELLYGCETSLEEEVILEESVEDEISTGNGATAGASSRASRSESEPAKKGGQAEAADGANQLAVLNSPPLVNLAMSRTAPVHDDDVLGMLSEDFNKYVNCDSETSSGDGFEETNWEILNNPPPINSNDTDAAYTNCITISLGAGSSNTKQKIHPTKGMKTINKADQTEQQDGANEVDFEHSSALDCRSESGLLLNVELKMILINNNHSTRVARALIEPIASTSGAQSMATYKSGDLTETVDLLSTVFQKALSRISLQSDYKRLEALLEMWINLNMDAVTEQLGMSGPLIPLHKAGITAILSTTARWGTVNVRGWCLILQALSMCCTHDNFSETNYRPSEPETFDDSNLNYLAWVIATDQNFLPVLVKLFSANCSTSCGSSETRTKSDMLGSTVTSILESFLMRLVFRCNMMPCPENQSKDNPKILLLKLLLRLLEPGAALWDGTGALDAQKTLLDVLLSFSYDDVQSNYLILSIINSVAPVVHNYISCSESKIFDGTDASNSILFASVLGCESKQAPPITRQVLMCSLVNLCTKMLLIPVNQNASPLRFPQPMDSSSQTDELKAMRNPSANATSTIEGITCSHSGNAVSYLVDEVLKNNQTMQLLIQSLGKVQGSSFIVALGSISRDISQKYCLGETFTDALYRLLLFINMKTTTLDVLLTSIIQFLTPGDAWNQPCLSELLYCYLSQVIDCPKVLEQFSELGGFELLWTNLVKSVKWAGSGQISSGESGIVSNVLNQLNPALPAITTNFSPTKKTETDENFGGTCFPPPKAKTEVNDVNRYKGLYNFAPLAVISSSNRSARPADCLLQTAPHHFQRTKGNAGTPPWSYHFYPYENWVDLILTLPCAVMLHEVHLCPHSFSTIMSPSAVSIETGVDVSCLTPVTGQIMTAGMSSMMIVLPEPVVASIVIIRLTRPLDQSTLGLSQIKLLGTTALKTIPRQLLLRENGIVPPKTSVWWLRMIHHCVYEVEGGKPCGIRSALKVDKTMATLVNLLCQAEGEGNWQENHVDTPLEKIAVVLAESNQRLRSEILEGLLNHPVISLPTAISQDTAITLLYQLCIHDTSTNSARLLVNWLDKVMEDKLTSARCSLRQTTKSHLNPMLLQCVATVIWNCKLDISNLISESLLKKTYEYYKLMSSDTSERVSQILCSMCMVNPPLFLKLLMFMGILTVKESNPEEEEGARAQEPTRHSSFTDDMKESISGPEGEGRYHLQEKTDISITSQLLHTLSIVAQSPQAANILLDSGFPILLVKQILEWCKSELMSFVERESSTDQEKTDRCQEMITESPNSLDPETVAASLEAFVLLAQQHPIKEWLGSREGSVFWIPLLNVLGDPVVRDFEAPLHSSRFCKANLYTRIEDATISLMKECALFHNQNQKHLASVLCQLIQRQKSHSTGGITFLHSLSGFTRRLVLQVLLEEEYVAVNVTTLEGNFKVANAILTSPFLPHPRDGIGHRNQLLYLPVSTTVDQLMTLVTAHWQNKMTAGGPSTTDAAGADSNSQKRELGVVGLELVEKLSVAAGGAAKVKRIKNLKNKYQSKLPKQKKDSSAFPDVSAAYMGKDQARMAGQFCFRSEYVLDGRNCVPIVLSLAQIMTCVHSVDRTSMRINLELVRKSSLQNPRRRGDVFNLIKTPPVPSLLEAFTNLGVLSILAERMSLLYPDNSHQVYANSPAKSKSEDKNIGFGYNQEYLEATQMPDTFADFLESQMTNGPPAVGSGAAAAPAHAGILIPPHSLGAFTLFLRLPGYPEAMLADAKNACSLLRIALGANISPPEERQGYILATLPFQVLEGLLASMPLTTDDGQLLRRTCLKVGAVHLILACLAALSHQDSPEIIAALHHPNVPIGLLVTTARTSCTNRVVDSSNQSKMERDRCFYWAKGTGFGTGSTNQYWNVEHSLHKQQMEEQHIVWMLRLLSQYINPVFVSSNNVTPERSEAPSEFTDPAEEPSDAAEPETGVPDGIPAEVFTLFKCSGLISKMSSYLTNDSVLDMSRHVPLYRALMDLIKGIALSPMLMPLLLNGTANNHLPALLARMLVTVNTYMSKLTHKGSRGTKDKIPSFTTLTAKTTQKKAPETEDNDGEEGLALLVPHIRTAAWLVKKSMSKLKPDFPANNQSSESDTATQTAFEAYSAVLKPLQFDVYDMIVEGADGKLLFTVPYLYEILARNTGDQILCSQKRLKRLAQEVVTLSSSLPLSLSSSVFVRTDADRLDIMKVLITGPEDTPYANGCFEFDVFFPPDYPTSPLLIKLQTTGERKVRFNPNLYKDGKICLSILNTWHGRPEEKWNANTSSLLQVLVSIQSLILVAEPYFNEPGYERSRGTPGGIAKSNEYDANIRLATVRWAILNQLRNPSGCFKEIIQRHFYLKKNLVLETIDSWVSELDFMRTSAGASFKTFSQHLKKLRTLVATELSRLKPHNEEAEGDKGAAAAHVAGEQVNAAASMEESLDDVTFSGSVGVPTVVTSKTVTKTGYSGKPFTVTPVQPGDPVTTVADNLQHLNDNKAAAIADTLKQLDTLVQKSANDVFYMGDNIPDDGLHSDDDAIWETHPKKDI